MRMSDSVFMGQEPTVLREIVEILCWSTDAIWHHLGYGLLAFHCPGDIAGITGLDPVRGCRSASPAQQDDRLQPIFSLGQRELDAAAVGQPPSASGADDAATPSGPMPSASPRGKRCSRGNGRCARRSQREDQKLVTMTLARLACADHHRAAAQAIRPAGAHADSPTCTALSSSAQTAGPGCRWMARSAAGGGSGPPWSSIERIDCLPGPDFLRARSTGAGRNRAR